MLERFKSDQIRLDALANQQVVGGDKELAAELDKRGKLVECESPASAGVTPYP